MLILHDSNFIRQFSSGAVILNFILSAKFKDAIRLHTVGDTKQHKMDGIDTIQIHLEQVKSFTYLGSIVNGNNSIEEEIKERISLGNEAF